MSELFKVAVIGAGNMGYEHIRAFNALENVAVVGLHSRTREKAQNMASELEVPAVYDSIDDLYNNTQAELVIVAVPELSANKVAKECFKYDWAVLLEKPAGYDLKDAQDIANTAINRKKPVMVGFNRRFYSSTQSALRDLDTLVSSPRFIHVQDQQSYEEARAHNHPEEVVEKFMYANSIHNIDYIRIFGRGEIKNVTPIMPWRGDKTDFVLAHITFSSGDIALYEGIWKGPGPWACTITTSERRWEMRPLEQAAFQVAGQRKLTSIDIDPVDSKYKAGFYRQAEDVVARVRGIKNPESPLADLEDSLKTMKLIQAIFGV